MDELRETIARAMQHSDAWMGCDDEGWTCSGKECRYCWEVAQGCADAVIAALGLTEELGSKSHGPSPMDCGVTPGPDILGRHNHRRYVTPWETFQPKETP